MGVPIKSIGGNPIVPEQISGGATEGNYALLTAGAADGIKGGGPTVDTPFLRRVSGGGQASDGPATIEVIRGNTLRWNQLVSDSATSVTVPSGHKYVARIDGTATLATSDGTAITVTGGTDNVFDLTAMFGAGNEPSTIEEFTALYPLPYYPYNAGSLLSVNMEGIETTGFNQWDEQWDVGNIDSTTGAYNNTNSRLRSKNLFSVFPSTEYNAQFDRVSDDMSIFFYDADRSFISGTGWVRKGTFTTPANARYMAFMMAVVYGTTYNHDICINLSGSRNGEYEPYWSAQRLIAAGTLRRAGNVYDELTATERIVRVAAMELDGDNDPISVVISQNSKGISIATVISFGSGVPDAANGFNVVTCDKLPTVASSYTSWTSAGISGWSDNSAEFIIAPTGDGSITTVGEFKAWLAQNPLTIYYAVKTPTVTPIDPPLNMSYRAAQGGTETVLVPTGEMSAPVPMVVVYGSTPDGILDRSASLLAAADGPTATANHAIGSYLTMGGQLYKVTTAIASGEAIVPGTNVTATTVMAEVLSLIQ